MCPISSRGPTWTHRSCDPHILAIQQIRKLDIFLQHTHTHTHTHAGLQKCQLHPHNSKATISRNAILACVVTHKHLHNRTCENMSLLYSYIYIYIYQANKALYQYNPKQPMHRMSQWPMGARNVTQRACKRDVIHSNAMWQCCVVDCNRDVAPINGSKIFTKRSRPAIQQSWQP
jgi:hypothetical protein